MSETNIITRGTRVTNTEILEAMRELRSRVDDPRYPRPVDKRFGICMNTRVIISRNRGDDWFAICGNAYGRMTELFEGWPKHSGNPSYPISLLGETDHPNGSVYIGGPDERDAWVGGYLELRKELMDYTIQKLEKLVQEEQNAVPEA